VRPGDRTHGRANKQEAEGHVCYDPRCAHAHGCVRACVFVRVRERETGTRTQTVSVSTLVNASESLTE